MKDKDKKKLYYLTFLIDIILFLILKICILNNCDKIFIYTALFVHFSFYISLYSNNKLFLHIIHHFVFILPLSSLILDSIYIKIISLLVLIIIQFLWIIERRCILNESHEELGYGPITNISIKVLSVILIYQIII
jgi:hypothetical protein